MEPVKPVIPLKSPLVMNASAFAEAGHKLVDQIAAFLNELPSKPVTTGEQPSQIRAALGDKALPLHGSPADSILGEAAGLLFDHSLFNGHPSFWGYITSSAAPIGALGDLLAAAVNPNTGAYILSPMATEIERQTVQWLAEFIGYGKGSSGLFVSGGNMANFVGFLAARRVKCGASIRQEGMQARKLLVYCSRGTHTWIQKAADLFGLGTNAIRWVDMNASQQVDTVQLEQLLKTDIEKGFTPFLVVGSAGSVSTGVIDPLEELSRIAKSTNCWFHIDGAYGAPAALLPEYAESFKGLIQADSIAIDPHKWLYSPLEAGCILVREGKHLTDTFSFHPEYYNFDGIAEDPCTNYFDYGMQNSRGFRALKVWLAIRQAGRNGYETMIRKDISLAKALFEMADASPELEALTHSLSITTFRYVPSDIRTDRPEHKKYLDELNEALLNRLQGDGKVFLSNAVVNGNYCLRVCIVNFRTMHAHLAELVDVVVAEGKKMHTVLKEKLNYEN